VLSAGQNYQKDAEGKPVLVQVVNLLVTPAQAEMLNLATDERIQLVLRNPADDVITQTTGAVTANLFEGGAIHVARAAVSRDASSAPVAPKIRPKADAPPVSVAALPIPVNPPVTTKIPVMEVLSGGARTQVVLHDSGKSDSGSAQ
jgi:pilus assembly protein CpaB